MVVSSRSPNMEQSRQRLLAEFENLRFGDRWSCESMPQSVPQQCLQPRTPQPCPPARTHRLASLWRSATDLRNARTIQAQAPSPFASPDQQARPFDRDTVICPSKPATARRLNLTPSRLATCSQVGPQLADYTGCLTSTVCLTKPCMSYKLHSSAPNQTI